MTTCHRPSHCDLQLCDIHLKKNSFKVVRLHYYSEQPASDFHKKIRMSSLYFSSFVQHNIVMYAEISFRLPLGSSRDICTLS